MASRESLFSLEVVVEKLCLFDVTCRFPTVAFRLLDFPTLVINHVGIEQSAAIRQKLALELRSNLPRQFKELQDKNGCFLIKRGKSCLFKISIETLQCYLAASPLYILLTDSFPETPKLVGSCFVSLENAMQEIVHDVQKQGLTIPTTHGEKGNHSLYNMMGVEIGNITVACRLISLGEGLIQHIPDSEIFTLGDKSENYRDTVIEYRKNKADLDKEDTKHPAPRNIADEILSDVRKSVEKESRIVSKKLKDQGLQTIEIDMDKPIHKVISTQTDPSEKKVTFDTPKAVETEELDDLFIINTYAPPALLYTKENENKASQNKYQIFQFVNVNVEEKANDETDSVRSDDQIFDILEVGLDHTLIKHEEPQFIQRVKKSESQIIPEPITVSHTKKHPNAAHMFNQNAFNDGNFPFLRALVSELSFLQGPEYLEQIQGKAINKIPESKKQFSKPRPIVAWTNNEKENRSEFLSRLSDPKQKSKPRKKHVHECENIEDTSIPKEKGWLRKEPVYGKHKSKLVYGMTRTQKLRCKLHGQLSYAEDIEESRKLQRPPPKKPVNEPHRPPQAANNLSRTQVISKPNSLTETHKVASRRPRRAPIPTPRRTPTPSFDEQGPDPSPEVPERGRRLSPVPYISPEEDDESEDITHSTPRSIEIHMPQVTNQRPNDFGKTRNIVSYYDNVQNVGGVNISMPAPDGGVAMNLDDLQQWQSVDEPELHGLNYSEDEESQDPYQSSPSIPSPVNVRSSLVKPVINPKSSERSPQTVQVRRSINLAQSIDAESSADSKVPVKPKRSVSFEGSLSEIGTKMPPIASGIRSSQESHVDEKRKLPPIRRSPSVESEGKGKVSTTRNFGERPKLKSVHTDSVSSYFPSEAENVGVSFDNSTDTYTEDFEGSDMDFPHYIPSTKLGYTIS